MDIKRALTLQIGEMVGCPTDRGDAGYNGRVTYVSEHVNKNIDGVEYVWVTVKKNGKTSHVWPSNRLG